MGLPEGPVCQEVTALCLAIVFAAGGGMFALYLLLGGQVAVRLHV